MLKQTIQLFIKATIVGILINAGLEQLPSPPAPIEDQSTAQHDLNQSEWPVVDGRTAKHDTRLD